MFLRRKYRFFRLLEDLKGDNKQENAISDLEIYEYAEKTGEKTVEINGIV